MTRLDDVDVRGARGRRHARPRRCEWGDPSSPVASNHDHRVRPAVPSPRCRVRAIEDGPVDRAARPARHRGADGDPGPRPGQEPEPLAVTMRTPGNDFELAVGFCRTEGLLARRRRPRRRSPTASPASGGAGVQRRHRAARRPVDLDDHRRRRSSPTSSCGLCGKTTLDEVEVALRRRSAAGPVVARSALLALPGRAARRADRVRRDRRAARGRPASPPTASCVALREDVGRHNALDKLVGHALLERRAAARATRS